ncbi:MAG: 2'-5' RNA ligase family protein [Chloroflexi bacterium]|nr:2'-5' RNA ligase family protein [Chloroflexota bacterium]
MRGIVSLPNNQHTELIEALWAEMGHRFEVKMKGDTAVPHFSYHVAETYEIERLGGILEGIVRETAVFTIQATGIGIFPGETPIIYIPIARNPALAHLHERLWTAVEPISQASVIYYAPDSWLSHITLANGNVTPEKLGPVAEWLHSQNINWTLPVDNLAVISDENGRQMRYRFGR